MKKNTIIFGLGLILLITIVVGEYYYDYDLWVQNQFFNFDTKEWLISPAEHKHLSFIFYKGIKIFMIILGIILTAILALSIKYQKLRKYNQPNTILLLSMICVPSIISGLKHITNVYCPRQLEIYNGRFPFIKILESYPPDFNQDVPGLCFPAGHATAGFCFMALYYCFKTPRYRWLGLGIGLILGWTTGLYQMLRGQHFLSHTLFTMVASFMIITALDIITRRYIYKTR